MSLAVGPYGIEYDPERRDSGSPGLRRLIVFILVVTVISLTVTLVKRAFRADDQIREEQIAETTPAAEPRAPTRTNATAVQKSVEPPVADATPIPDVISETASELRPVRVRNLLLRLEEAEKRRDVAMAVSTIEQICSLPGDPAHDLYDRLFRRAGELNMKWLFEEYNARWVSTVTVKSGDSATRLVSRNGSTLASMKRLNPKIDLEHLRIGDVVRVMTRPRFNLIVHKRSRLADLKLNGRFFKRYDILETVAGAVGAYEIDQPVRKFLSEKGITFSRDDRNELETLVPKGSLLVISEL